MKTIDLSNLSAEELQAELKKRDELKEKDRKAYKQVVVEQLPEVVEYLRRLSDNMSEVKYNVFNDLKVLLELKQEAYSVKSEQQSHTFSDDKGNTITYGFRILDAWDDTVNEGIAKVVQFLNSLARNDESAKLVSVINNLLKKDQKGNLKASRVLELQKMASDFENEDFKDGVDIISKAHKPVRSAFFIDASYTDNQGKSVNIPLSISAVDFPKDKDVDDLFPVDDRYNADNN